ncbi:hypothetical protein ACOMHN_052811 [Nucella lapillus]
MGRLRPSQLEQPGSSEQFLLKPLLFCQGLCQLAAVIAVIWRRGQTAPVYTGCVARPAAPVAGPGAVTQEGPEIESGAGMGSGLDEVSPGGGRAMSRLAFCWQPPERGLVAEGSC